MTQKEAQLMILQDVVGHYNLSNRSTNGFRCVYNSLDGKHCAAARWMTDPSKAIDGAIIYPFDDSVNRDIKEKCFHNFNLLKPEAQLAGGEFMQKIQSLHDRAYNWGDTGLSMHG